MRISSRRQLAEFKSAVSDSLGFSKGLRWVFTLVPAGFLAGFSGACRFTSIRWKLSVGPTSLETFM